LAGSVPLACNGSLVMCGRLNLIDSPQLHDVLQALNLDRAPVPTRYNIAPTEPVMTIYQQSPSIGSQTVYGAQDMRWWLTPRWVKEPSQKFAMFNARAETVASSKAFAQPFKHQRAIIPASSFIEWQTIAGHKQAYEIACEQSICLFAAIWEQWQQGDHEIYSCAILTTAAVSHFEVVHQRQPLLLDIESAKAWLQHGQSQDVLTDLMRPRLPVALLATPITNSLNNARNKLPPEPNNNTVLRVEATA